MRFTRIPEAEWRKLIWAVENAEKVKGRVSRIVELLDEVFSRQKEVGITFMSRTEWPVCAEIESPIGRGRLRLEWAVVDAGLAGIVVLDREGISQSGRTEFCPLWGFVVPEYGDPYIGHDDDRVILRTHMQFGGQVHNSVYELGMSILYMLATGGRSI